MKCNFPFVLPAFLLFPFVVIVLSFAVTIHTFLLSLVTYTFFYIFCYWSDGNFSLICFYYSVQSLWTLLHNPSSCRLRKTACPVAISVFFYCNPFSWLETGSCGIMFYIISNLDILKKEVNMWWYYNFLLVSSYLENVLHHRKRLARVVL